MKKTYITPAISLIRLNTEDICEGPMLSSKDADNSHTTNNTYDDYGADNLSKGDLTYNNYEIWSDEEDEDY